MPIKDLIAEYESETKETGELKQGIEEIREQFPEDAKRIEDELREIEISSFARTGKPSSSASSTEIYPPGIPSKLIVLGTVFRRNFS